MDIVTFVIIALVLYFFFVVGVALYNVRWLEPLDHERYSGLNVYAVDDNGTRWRLEKGLLELYSTTKKGPHITELPGQPPAGTKIREIKSWKMTVGIPVVVLAPLVKVLRGK